jgi:hypothetical protein
MKNQQQSGLAHWPKRPNGPSGMVRGAPAQRVVTAPRTGAVAWLPAPGTVTRWGVVAVASTGEARPPRGQGGWQRTHWKGESPQRDGKGGFGKQHSGVGGGSSHRRQRRRVLQQEVEEEEMWRA